MELNTESILLQGNITGPAFLVKDGMIKEANAAAIQRGFTVEKSIYSLIGSDEETYSKYKSGKLYLQLVVGGRSYGAAVTIVNDYHLFCLESDYENNQLQILSLVSQQLRGPISNAMLSTSQLQQNTSLQDDQSIQASLGQINRALHQLTRAVCNMSDVSNLHLLSLRMENRNITALLNELLPQVEDLIVQAGKTLKVKKLSKSITCLVDPQLFTRSILNLISNAAQFSPNGSEIKVKFEHSNNILRITVENPNAVENSPLLPNAFHRFLREPGIEDERFGIGLGMSLIRNIAITHGGTVLFDSSKKNTVKVVMTISTNRTEPPILRSKIQLIGGYNGGLDTLLTELADVLPASLYEGF